MCKYEEMNPPPARNCEEARYYGSDLNKLIGERCSRRMTVNNVDGLIWKSEGRRLRLIESKQSNEIMKWDQNSLLSMLARCLKFHWGIFLVPVEIFVVYGDYPHLTSRVIDMATKKEYTLTQDQLIRWINFDVEIEDL